MAKNKKAAKKSVPAKPGPDIKAGASLDDTNDGRASSDDTNDGRSSSNDDDDGRAHS
jgi:hypothetical protein